MCFSSQDPCIFLVLLYCKHLFLFSIFMYISITKKKIHLWIANSQHWYQFLTHSSRCIGKIFWTECISGSYIIFQKGRLQTERIYRKMHPSWYYLSPLILLNKLSAPWRQGMRPSCLSLVLSTHMADSAQKLNWLERPPLILGWTSL